jgi:hypothetical protein
MIEFEIQDRRDDATLFSSLELLDCFYVGDPKEPYIRVPEYQISESVPVNSDIVSPFVPILSIDKDKIRTFNALRIRTLQYIFIVPTNTVHKLQSKLTLITEALQLEKEVDAEKNNTVT